MKYLPIVIALLFAAPVWGQSSWPASKVIYANDDTVEELRSVLDPYAIGSLPTCDTNTPYGETVYVNDSSNDDCSTAGGSTWVLCGCTDADAWSAVGGGGGGAFDSTAEDTLTWGDGSLADFTWTMDLSGTDHTYQFTSSGLIASGNLFAHNLVASGGQVTAGFGGVDGSVVIYSDEDDDTVTLSAHDSDFTPWELVIPPDDGDAGEFLQTDGSGNTIWAAGGGAEVNNLETITTDILDDEIFVGDGGDAGTYRVLPNGAVSYDTTGETFSQAGISDLASSTSADLGDALDDETGEAGNFLGSDFVSDAYTIESESTTGRFYISGVGFGGATVENLTFDFRSVDENTTLISTSTGSNVLKFSGMTLTSNVGTAFTNYVKDKSGDTTPSAITVKGGHFFFTKAGTQTMNIPSAEAGMYFCAYKTDNAGELRIDPNVNDHLRVNNAALADGEYAYSSGAEGDWACFIARSTSEWYMQDSDANGWTEETP